jgi:hypothetical protein
MPLTPEQLYEATAGSSAAALTLCLLGYLGAKLAASALRAAGLGGYWREVLHGRWSAGLILHLLAVVSGVARRAWR